jgi:HAD superfamily hydrolase (TIGR01509 family)
MTKKICVLFDMDGVVIDTESQYDKIWKSIGEKYHVGIPDFEKVIKGTTLDNIINRYFSQKSNAEIAAIEKELDDFEERMGYPEIPGVLNFIRELKSAQIKIGLVTSSARKKLEVVKKYWNLNELFDTVVFAERITHSKPNPECFLLAARDLSANPEDCIVFEDSFAGIEAGKSAGMKVVALATTHGADKLRDKTEADTIIPNFLSFGLKELLSLV